MMGGTDHLAGILEGARELRESVSAFSLGKMNTRWRGAPSGSSYYGRDVQITERELFTSYAVVAELLLTHPQVDSALRSLVANSGISQIRPSADTDSQTLNQMLDEAWCLKAHDPLQCDVYEQHDYYQLRSAAWYIRHAFGDVCSPILEGTRLQVTEPWRMRSPTTSNNYGKFGIERDANGLAPTGYYLTKNPKSIYDQLKVNEVQLFDAKDEAGEKIFLHVTEPGRVASRTVSRLTPVADLLGMGQDLFFSEVIRQQLCSATVFSNEIDADAFEILKGSNLLNADVINKLFDIDARKFKVNPASILSNLPGFKLRQVTSNINPANMEFLWKQITQMLAMVLDMPRLAVELDATDANYAQFRAVLVLLDERMKFNHDCWITQWDRPIWRHFVRSQLVSDTPLGEECRKFVSEFQGAKFRGEISPQALDALCKVDWNYPARRYTQPVHEAQGDAISLAEGLETPCGYVERTHAMSWEKFADEQIENRLYLYKQVFAAQKALMIEFGASEEEAAKHILTLVKGLHHSEFCPLPRPKQVYASLPVDLDPPKTDPPKPKAAAQPVGSSNTGVAA